MNTGCKAELPVDLFGDKEKYFTCWPNLGCLKRIICSVSGNEHGLQTGRSKIGKSGDKWFLRCCPEHKCGIRTGFHRFCPKKENPDSAFAGSSDLKLTFSSLLVQIRAVLSAFTVSPVYTNWLQLKLFQSQDLRSRLFSLTFLLLETQIVKSVEAYVYRPVLGVFDYKIQFVHFCLTLQQKGAAMGQLRPS